MDPQGRVEIVRTVERIIYDSVPQIQQTYLPHSSYAFSKQQQQLYQKNYLSYANQCDNFQSKFTLASQPENESYSADRQIEMIRKRMYEQKQQQPSILSPFNISLNTTLQDEHNTLSKTFLSSSVGSSNSLSLSNNNLRYSTPIANHSMSVRREALPGLSCISSKSFKLKDETNTIKGREESMKEITQKETFIRKNESNKQNSIMTEHSPENSYTEVSRSIHKTTPVSRRSCRVDLTLNRSSKRSSSRRMNTYLQNRQVSRNASIDSLRKSLQNHRSLTFDEEAISFDKTTAPITTTLEFSGLEKNCKYQTQPVESQAMIIGKSKEMEVVEKPQISQLDEIQESAVKIIEEIEGQELENVKDDEKHESRNIEKINNTEFEKVEENNTEFEKVEENNTEFEKVEENNTEFGKDDEKTGAELEKIEEIKNTEFEKVDELKDAEYEKDDEKNGTELEKIEEINSAEFEKIHGNKGSQFEIIEENKNAEVEFERVKEYKDAELEEYQDKSSEMNLDGTLRLESAIGKNITNDIRQIQKLKAENEVSNIDESEVINEIIETRLLEDTPKFNKNATTFCNISIQVTPTLFTHSHWNLDNDSRAFDSTESKSEITTGIATETFDESLASSEQLTFCKLTRLSPPLQESSFTTVHNESSIDKQYERSSISLQTPENKVQDNKVDFIAENFESQIDDEDNDSNKENCPPFNYSLGDSGEYVEESNGNDDVEDEYGKVDQVLMSEDSEPENRMRFAEEIVGDNLTQEPIISFPDDENHNVQEQESLSDETFHVISGLPRHSFVVKRKREDPISPQHEKRFKASENEAFMSDNIPSQVRNRLEASLENSRRVVLAEIVLPITSTPESFSFECVPVSSSNDVMSNSLKTNTTIDQSRENEAVRQLEIDDVYGDSIEELLTAEFEKHNCSLRKLVNYSDSILIDESRHSSNGRDSIKNRLVNYSSVLFDDSNEEGSIIEHKMLVSEQKSEMKVCGSFVRPKTTIEILENTDDESFSKISNPNETYIKSSMENDNRSLKQTSVSHLSKQHYSKALVDYSICSSSDDSDTDEKGCFGDNYFVRNDSSSDEEESVNHVLKETSVESLKKKRNNSVCNNSLGDSALSLSLSSSENDVEFDVSNANAVIRPKKCSPGLRRSKRNRVPICALWFGQKPVYRPEIDKFGNYVRSLVGVTSPKVAPLSERRYPPQQAKNKRSQKNRDKKNLLRKHRTRVISESDSDSVQDNEQSDSSESSKYEKTIVSKKKNTTKVVDHKRRMSEYLNMSIHAPSSQLPVLNENAPKDGKHFTDYLDCEWIETKSPGVYNCVQAKDKNGASGSMKFENFSQRLNYKCSNYSLQCWVSYGVFSVTVGTITRILKSGDFFKVPIGGGYSLVNLRDDNGLINYQLSFDKISSN